LVQSLLSLSSPRPLAAVVVVAVVVVAAAVVVVVVVVVVVQVVVVTVVVVVVVVKVAVVVKAPQPLRGQPAHRVDRVVANRVGQKRRQLTMVCRAVQTQATVATAVEVAAVERAPPPSWHRLATQVERPMAATPRPVETTQQREVRVLRGPSESHDGSARVNAAAAALPAVVAATARATRSQPQHHCDLNLNLNFCQSVHLQGIRSSVSIALPQFVKSITNKQTNETKKNIP
jgi:hypothetical protein